MSVIGSTDWIKNQIEELSLDYEINSDEGITGFIDGKLTILKLWLDEKTKNKMTLEVEFTDKGSVEHHLSGCEGQHVQQVVYSTYHKALTQICFGCEKIRTSMTKDSVISTKGETQRGKGK